MALGRAYEDLSVVHEPIGTLFRQEDKEGCWLEQSQIDAYRRDGFVPGIRILNERQLQAIRTELAEFLEPNHAGREFWYEYHRNESADPSKVLFHALGAWRLREACHDILWHDAILQPASQLLGGAVRFWHDQLFCKPPHEGGVVAWHQDYSYWTRTKPLAHLTCWIGVDDSTIENGCLQYIPGSHRWELLPQPKLAGELTGIRDVLSKEQRHAFDSPVTTELRAGECVFHHPLTLHGSLENRSPNPRRAIVLNFVLDGVHSDSDEALLQGVPPIPQGERLDGRFFPLLFDPADMA